MVPTSIFADFNGKVRVYNNIRDFKSNLDTHAFAAGGQLSYLSPELKGISARATFYTSHDLDLNHSDTSRVTSLLPGSPIDILGESYIMYKNWNTAFTHGRQIVKTPFINPADAFMIPMTFQGTTVNGTYGDFKIHLSKIGKIKDRHSDKFLNIGRFVLARFGAALVTNTDGLYTLGAEYNNKKASILAYDYKFEDILNMIYAQPGYSFNNKYLKKLEVQYLAENSTGKELLGQIDSKVLGALAVFQISKAKFLLGYNRSSGNDLKGKSFAPTNYFTDPIFTNSMLSGVLNLGQGNSYKITWLQGIADNLNTKLSFAYHNFKTDVSEIDFDIRYKLKKYIKDLSITNRVGVRNSDSDALKLAAIRTQFEYSF